MIDEKEDQRELEELGNFMAILKAEDVSAKMSLNSLIKARRRNFDEKLRQESNLQIARHLKFMKDAMGQEKFMTFLYKIEEYQRSEGRTKKELEASIISSLDFCMK